MAADSADGFGRRLNYYPFHIGDYASATRHLSWDEDSAYRRLLDVYYTTEKPLPLEPKACCRLVMAHTEAQREAVSTVLVEFFDQTPDGWVNGRADAEIVVMRDKQQKQRDKANRRWHPPVPEPGSPAASLNDAVANAAASKSDANAMPPTPTPTPTPTPKKENTRKRATSIPAEFGISERVRTWAEKKGLNHLDAQFEAFVSYAKRKGATYVDWDEALMAAIRDDWARARGKVHENPFAGAI